MLPKKQRLNLSLEQNRLILSRGRKIHSQHFILFYRLAPKFKASVIIPKKQAALAVKRNQLRRRIYQIIDDFIQDFSIKASTTKTRQKTTSDQKQRKFKQQQSLELVIMLKKRVKINFHEMQQELAPKLKQIFSSVVKSNKA